MRLTVPLEEVARNAVDLHGQLASRRYDQRPRAIAGLELCAVQQFDGRYEERQSLAGPCKGSLQSAQTARSTNNDDQPKQLSHASLGPSKLTSMHFVLVGSALPWCLTALQGPACQTCISQKHLPGENRGCTCRPDQHETRYSFISARALDLSWLHPAHPGLLEGEVWCAPAPRSCACGPAQQQPAQQRTIQACGWVASKAGPQDEEVSCIMCFRCLVCRSGEAKPP